MTRVSKPHTTAGRFAAMAVAITLGCTADVIVGRVNVTPSGGSTDERPQSAVVGQRPGAGFFATSNNRGDWNIAVDVTPENPKGTPLLLTDGVPIPSLNESAPAPHRGIMGTGGKLTTGTASSLNGGFWVSGFTAQGNGAEANYDFALAYFPFRDGWISGHVAKDGMTWLARGNLPEDAEIRRMSGGVFSGEILLRIPGVHSVEDGILFTTAAGNADKTTAVGPLADGTGWHIRVADESQNYRSEQAAPWSFVFVPYTCRGLIGGKVIRDGTVTRGVGEFDITRTQPGRYEVFIPGKSDADGILLLNVTMLNKDGVEDNAMAWSFDPDRRGGAGAFVIESYDQPDFNDQDVEFCFAFLAYENSLSPAQCRTSRLELRDTWKASVASALAMEADLANSGALPVSRTVADAAPRSPLIASLQGHQRLWLTTRKVGNPGNARAVWASPAFILQDGTQRSLSVDNIIYSRGLNPGTPGDNRVENGDRTTRRWVVDSSSVMFCMIPNGAVSFRADVELTKQTEANGKVTFCIAHEPHNEGFWYEEAWPKLRSVFPVQTRRLAKDLKQTACLRQLEPKRCIPLILSGLKEMEKALGPLAQRLPEADNNDLPALLARHGAAACLLDDVQKACDTIWQRTPLLAQLIDYPEPKFQTLRASIERIAATRPQLKERAQEAIRALEDCESRCVTMLNGVLTGRDPREEDTLQIEKTASRIAEWSSRMLGWTTFGGDNQRSWVCREPLELPLKPEWTHVPQSPPAPAWPPPRRDNPAVNHQLSPTLTYDRAFHPVMTADALVFGSSSEDAVICLDPVDASERWRFITGGPVRLAPVIYRNRVIAGSDDGKLYCLDLEDGHEYWSYRASGGNDQRLAGNGRVISTFAIRCGICVDDGTIYAGAGILPSMGAVLFALDAENGREKWRQKISWAPHGFMLLSPSHLFVPTGRTPFRSFSRTDGKPLSGFGRSDSWGRDLPGGTLALVVNDRLLTGPDEGGEFHMYDTGNSECLVKVRGKRVIVDGLVTYILRDHTVTAQERDPFVRRGGIKTLWKTSIENAYCMLKAGNHLILGCAEGRIRILDALSGTEAQQLDVGESRVEGIVWNNGRLVVSLADGTLCCLTPGDTGTASADKHAPATTPPIEKDATTRARNLAAACGFRKGYALVYGDADLAVALAKTTELQTVLAVESPDDVTTWRNVLKDTGLYGRHISVHHLDADVLPYRPYLFNLVAVSASVPGMAASEWFRVLRPDGGMLVTGDTALSSVPVTSVRGDVLSRACAGFPFVFRRGPLSGIGSWTHGYADPGNTACSDDALPFGEFDVLWFGRPGPRNMFERHVKAAPPLCLNGTVYITGNEYLAAADVYNGAVLWEKNVPGSGRMAMLKDCGNMVAAGTDLFVAIDGQCVIYEGRTGVEKRRYPVQNNTGSEGRWSYLAFVDDLLLGGCAKPGARFVPGNKADYNAIWYHFQPVATSRSLFALGRLKGESRWRYQPRSGVILNPTITVVGDTIAFVESTNPATAEDPDGKVPLPELLTDSPVLTGLDVHTGKEIWRTPMDLSTFHHAIYMSGRDGMLVLTGTRHDQVDERKLIQYQLIGVDMQTGKEIWRNDNTPTRAHILDGGHGEQTQHPAIVGDIVYGPGFARNLRTGDAHDGWLWQKSPQCATLSTSLNCAFSRQHGNPTAAAFLTGKERQLTRTTRPGCWINTLPAAGLVIIPEASSGCTCQYSVQTTLALYPLISSTTTP